MSDLAVGRVLDALADEQHANLCNCADYPNGCVSRTGYTRDYLISTLTYAEDALAKAIQQGWQPPASLGVSGEDRSEPTPADRLTADDLAGTATPELVHTWKVQVSAAGVHLTLNGKTYELGDSRDAVVFDLERAAAGYTVPDRMSEVVTPEGPA